HDDRIIGLTCRCHREGQYLVVVYEFHTGYATSGPALRTDQLGGIAQQLAGLGYEYQLIGIMRGHTCANDLIIIFERDGLELILVEWPIVVAYPFDHAIASAQRQDAVERDYRDKLFTALRRHELGSLDPVSQRRSGGGFLCSWNVDNINSDDASRVRQRPDFPTRRRCDDRGIHIVSSTPPLGRNRSAILGAQYSAGRRQDDPAGFIRDQQGRSSGLSVRFR